ncbi:hypothetical protein [Sphingosinithalassobacter portus]|uniref:hypothetical protein n=1 Tax=Stakelama portus TaxID=2676234 RepID=UPI000D6DEE56|nr:hypothetical protein [Sphingosinithalassobacter portus]
MIPYFALALLPLLALSPVEADTRLDETLAAFDAQCAPLDSVDGLAARAETAGWTAFTPDADSSAGKLLTITQDAAEKSGVALDARTFRNAVYGDRVLFVAQVSATSGAGSVECRILDETGGAPDIEPLTQWAGRAPQVRTLPSGAASWFWPGGVRVEANFTVALYVEPGTSAAQGGVGFQIASARVTR